MLKFSRKMIPGAFMALALILGAWTYNPVQAQQQGKGPRPEDVKLKTSGTLSVSGPTAQIPNVQQRINEAASLKFDYSAVNNSNVGEFDKSFVEDSLVSNTLELMTMEYALPRVQNAELKSLIQMMITMHSNDTVTVKGLSAKLGTKTSVDMSDLTSATVLEGTPDYDLGKRTENLYHEYIDRLVDSNGHDFDKEVIEILTEEHTQDIQSELTAMAFVQNNDMRAFAKHSADVTELHLQLLDELHNRLYSHQESSPDFQSQYTSPMQFFGVWKSVSR